ncbi:serine/threonine protein phosphatase [Heliomicrobium modesticaldum Ice1]|uniref:Serine/threonine protein phosphatase n=1 Tax=Heliobacterium modesticaldum (strain ATCC 51547 / Ice1) TaxID=498761 RepID=B0TG60_HELMI|nr:metallophosphoesterase family protein [Heliomicrobium modesticaldum]ABZ84556.1 serine/threonine protein phosphatase [Heliomicrobium modesticaldum Ice1]
MRYGILADVHGKSEALQKALRLLQDVDRIVFLGDVPGYRDIEGMPECLQALAAEGALAVRGNCDAYMLAHRRPPEIAAPLWDYYTAWPEEILEGDLLFVHGGPRDPLHERVNEEERAWRNFRARQFAICFHGHEHRVTAFASRDDGDVETVKLPETGLCTLEANRRYIIGVGSVGKPKDECRGSVVLFDAETRMLRVERFTID